MRRINYYIISRFDTRKKINRFNHIIINKKKNRINKKLILPRCC